MRARPQRTHYMGQSNRNSSSVIENNNNMNNKTFDILEKSFNKTKSQYYHSTMMNNNNKVNNNSMRGVSMNNNNNNNKNKIIANLHNNSSSNGVMNQQHQPTNTTTTKYYTSQLNINTIYKDAEKGHHYQFQNTKFMNNKKLSFYNNKSNNKINNSSSNISNQQQQQPLINPPPINMNTRLNSSISQLKQLLMNNINSNNNNINTNQHQHQHQQQQQQINLYKIKQLKKTLLRNNQKRRNLKQYYQKYVNKQTGKIDKIGFKKMIKQYGYDINDQQIRLVFGLNAVVHQDNLNNNNFDNKNNIPVNKDINNKHANNKDNSYNIDNINHQQLNLPQFINLLTKQNIYFQTLKQLPKQKQQKQQIQTKKQSSLSPNNKKQPYRFSPAQFQIFRNKYHKLKQALKIYKNQPITKQKFQNVMKKLDITDLVLTQSKRQSIFNQFAKDNNNQLNVQRLLGMIATQQHQRISNEKQMRLTNHDKFQQNIPVNQQYKFQKFNKNDPLLQLLYPKNLKRSSFVDYEKSVKQARNICQCLKQIKKTKSKDIIKQLLQYNNNKLNKQQLYKRIQKILQQQGYNFNKNQYKSFISYIDFDSNNNVTKQKLQNIIFNQDQSKRINRLDRRVRNQDNSQRLLLTNNNNNFDNKGQQFVEQKNPQDQFVNKMRAKSSVNWNTMKRTFIKQDNIPQFKVPTKFSAWPQRLYQTDLSLIQAKQSFGMGINEHSRFHKEQKHSLAQQDRLKRLLNYENKVRKVAEWQQINNKKILQMSKAQQKKQQSKMYNLRLLKQQYEDRCHSKSFVQ